MKFSQHFQDLWTQVEAFLVSLGSQKVRAFKRWINISMNQIGKRWFKKKSEEGDRGPIRSHLKNDHWVWQLGIDSYP